MRESAMPERLMPRHAIFLAMTMLCPAACADQFSTQEAYTTCEEIADRTLTSNDASFANCVDCYERCGADCEQQNEEPPDEYFCPDDVGP